MYFLFDLYNSGKDSFKKLEQTDPQKASRIAQEHVQKVFRHLLKISGVTIEVNGLENIPDEAALFVGNHSSYFDIIVTGAAIPGGVGFVAKDSLGNIPGLSSWMKRIHCLFLDRKDIRKGLQTILEGAEYLKEGYSMCIYPEGTRSTNGELGEFKGGSLKMAQKPKPLLFLLPSAALETSLKIIRGFASVHLT